RKGIVQGGEDGAAATDKAVLAAGRVVFADDVACIVDAECKGGACEGPRNIESGEGAVFEVMQKAVMAGGVIVFADDLAAVVDAEGLGSVGGQGVVQCGEGAAAQEEAMAAPGVDVASSHPHRRHRGGAG